MFRFVAFYLIALLLAEASSKKIVISSGADLVKTLNDDKDLTYEGKTLILSNDIELTPQESESFHPIGENKYGEPFQGTFDGQGHIISGLNVTIPKLYVGLFGRSSGATITRVILDETCTFESTFISSLKSMSDLHIGTISGLCDDCSINQCVSMATVAFSGKLSHFNTKGGEAFIGGIAGSLSSVSVMHSCGMYGVIRHTGSTKNADLGGLVGAVLPSSRVTVECSGFYGTILHSSFTRWDLNSGGIIGVTRGYGCNIFRCVSAGKQDIESNPERKSVGSVIGAYNISETTGGNSGVKVINSVWDKEQTSPIVGRGEDTVSIAEVHPFALVGRRVTGDTELGVLGGDPWVLAEYKAQLGRFSSYTNSVKMFTPRTALPVPTRKGGVAFGGWFLDAKLSHPYKGESEEEMWVVLYPKWVQKDLVSTEIMIVMVIVFSAVGLYYHKKKKEGGAHSNNANK